MLKWNFKKLFKMRGVDSPYTWLRKLGLSRDVALRIANDTCDKIALKHLLTVCSALNCTPDDVLEWIPAKEGEDHPGNALTALKPGSKSEDAAELLRGLPAKQMKELAKMLRENRGSGKEGKG